MAAEASLEPVRISKIADRFLVFEAEDVARIRRYQNICSVLVGTTPQNPTQNVFLSLPLELLPEEASVLVEKKVGRLVDETSYHVSSLHSLDRGTRQAYIAALRDRRHKAQKLLAEDQARKAVTDHTWRGNDTKTPLNAAKLGSQSEGSFAGTLVQGHTPKAPDSPEAKALTVTPTTSGGLGTSDVEAQQPVPQPSPGPLHRHLQSRGYYMTPGLRFGADYSVYPGDPLRFHAHFLATNYDWDEKIPMLDVVGSGRLGTSVKKGFLFGGEVPKSDGSIDQVRTFCVEWAGM